MLDVNNNRSRPKMVIVGQTERVTGTMLCETVGQQWTEQNPVVYHLVYSVVYHLLAVVYFVLLEQTDQMSCYYKITISPPKESRPADRVYAGIQNTKTKKKF